FVEALDASAQVLSDSGTVSFGDIDTTDVVDITFVSDDNITWNNGDGEIIDAGLASALVAGFNTGVLDADAPGDTPWNYDTAGLDLDFLALGETITFSYTITATDNNGAFATDVVSFTITGTNDVPTISVTQSAGFVEALDASAQVLSDSGTVSFGDIDTTDVVDITFVSDDNITWNNGDSEIIDAGLASALVAGFNTGVLDADAPGDTPWNYDTAGLDLDFLALGETITFSYTITATDNNGAFATDVVSFTITGTNDVPTISATQSAGFVEALDASAQVLSDSGTVSFGDIDTTDVVDITFVSDDNITWNNGDGEIIDAGLASTLVAGFNTGVLDADAPGDTPWNYDTAGLDLDFLADGETITFSYTI
ncbi:hypothetical protein EKG38_24805, partial [Shewanella canadensis]